MQRKTERVALPEEDLALFQDAVRGARPIKKPNRATPDARFPPPVPVQSLLDAHETLKESISGILDGEQMRVYHGFRVKNRREVEEEERTFIDTKPKRRIESDDD